jgi:membrane protease YdiL (CAAX protease family)
VQYNWSGRDVFLISAGITLAFLAVIVGYRLYTNIAIPEGTQHAAPAIWTSLGLGLLEGIILISCVYYLGLKRRGLSWATAGIRPLTPEWLFKGLSLGILVIPLSGLIALAIQLIFDLPVSNPQIPFLAPDGFTWLGAIGMLLMGGFLAPFAEELYFRGVLYPWLRQRWGVEIAILASSFIFGIVHGNAALAGAAFVLGIILAWVYERSDSLWPAVLIHVINNSVKIAVLYILLAYNLLPAEL